jgi:hypothetical protein
LRDFGLGRSTNTAGTGRSLPGQSVVNAIDGFARRATHLALFVCPLLVIVQIVRWLNRSGWHYLTLASVTSWGGSPAAALPWSWIPLLLPLVLIPVLLHLPGWLWRGAS